MSAELVYPYRQSPGRLALGPLFFGLGGVFFLHKANGNQRGATIDFIIRLNPGEATVFYYILAVLMFGIAALALYSLFISFTKKMEIALEPSGIRLPVGLARRETTIAYADIKSIQHRKGRSTEFLVIAPRVGRPAFIAASMLPSKDMFGQVRTEVTARAKAAQSL
jgi:hypothetical protein